MARISMINIGAHGHVNPTLPVIGELVRRGAEVTYFATEEFRAAVEAQGGKFEAYQSSFASEGPPAGVPARELMAMMPAKLTRECLEALPQIETRLKALKPDVVLYDKFCLAARLLCGEHGWKAATFLPTYASNEHFSLMKLVPPSEHPPADHPAYAEFRQHAALIKERFGVAFNSLAELFSHPEPLNLCFVAKAFHYAGDTFDNTYQFVGPCIAPRPTHGSYAASDQRPVVLVSLGTVFNQWPEFFKMGFAAFAGAPYRVLMSIGKNIDPVALGAKPENITLSTYLPQLEILEKASAFVTHGGMNSTMEALWFGVPLVVIPQMMEQAATARRVKELGLGEAFTRETLTAQNLRQAVDHVMTDAGIRQRIKPMQAALRNSGGAARAAELVLDYAAPRLAARSQPSPATVEGSL